MGLVVLNFLVPGPLLELGHVVPENKRVERLGTRAVIVVQLIEWSHSKPEILDSNPDMSKTLSTNRTIEKMNIKKKRPGMDHL